MPPIKTWLGAIVVAGCAAAAVSTPRGEDAGELREEVFRRIDRGALALKRGDAIAAREDLCWAHRRALNNHTAAWYCGRAALASRDPERAVRALELAVALDPQHLASGVDLGRAYLSAGNVERARGAFFRVLEVRSDHAPAFSGLARVAEVTGDETRALELYAQALEANPADATSRLERGNLHLRRGRLDQALEDIREAARLRPDEADVQIGLAEALLVAKLYDQALAAARRAAELSPRSARAAALAGRTFLELGALPEAEEAARRALALDPEEPMAMLSLGEVLGRSGRFEEALAALEHPREEILTPDERGALAATRGRWEARRARLAELETAASSPTAEAGDLLALAEIRLATGGADEAAALARRALEDSAADIFLARRAAYVLGSAGSLLEAAVVLARITALPAAEGRDFVNAGISLERTGDPEGARLAYAEALTRAGEFPPPGDEVALAALGGLARLELAVGRTAAAVDRLSAMLRLSPPPDLRTRIEAVLERLASPPAAAAAPEPAAVTATEAP